MSTASEIARYYGQGKEERNRDGWLTCCPVHGDKTPSLSVTDKGDDDVDVYCHTGCDFKAIKNQFRADNQLPAWEPKKKNGTNTTAHTLPTPAPDHQPVTEEKVSFVWKQATIEGLEHAKKYFANRAITIDPLPLCIKWNSYTNKKTGETNNMIVAAASKPSDEHVYAVQRLFIDMDDYTKSGAKMHGPCEGRGVWFDRKADKAEIVIGEGIETTLSSYPGHRGKWRGGPLNVWNEESYHP